MLRRRCPRRLTPILDLDIAAGGSKRHMSQHDSNPVSDPFVPTEGIHNLRDYGGYSAVHDGGLVSSVGCFFDPGQHQRCE